MSIVANLRHAARNHEQVSIGGGVFSGKELTHAADLIEAADKLVAALSAALPFVEYALDDSVFKEGCPASVVKQIHQALKNKQGVPL